MPDAVQCLNGKIVYHNYEPTNHLFAIATVGSDGVDINWRCDAVIPEGWQMANVDVQCEGYDSPDDPYILTGSCGVSFDLVPDRSHRYYSSSTSSPGWNNYDNEGYSWGKLILTLLFFYMAWKMFFQSGYRFTPPTFSTYGTGGAGLGGSSSWGGFGSGGWRPGFFSGLGLGSMLGSAWRRPSYNRFLSFDILFSLH
jgi:hypothetical protein